MTLATFLFRFFFHWSCQDPIFSLCINLVKIYATRIRSVERGICPIASVCTALLSRSRDPCHIPFSNFFHCSCRDFPLSNLAKLEARNILELLPFNAPKITESRDHGRAHFSKTFDMIMSGLCPVTCLANMKYVSLALLEILAFNFQTLMRSRDPGHAHFFQNIS